jgi:hypothetical protein
MEDSDAKGSTPAVSSEPSISGRHAQTSLASTSPARALSEEDVTSSKENTSARAIPESTVEFAQKVSRFLTKVEPYKVLLFHDLRDEMDRIKIEANKIGKMDDKP